MSFMWMLQHRLLPTEERLSRLRLKNEPKCKFHCETEANIEHIFFECVLTKDVGSWLISKYSEWNLNPDPPSILKLEMNDFDALTWITAQSLHFIWTKRKNAKEAQVEECVAVLIDQANLLQETKHSLIANGLLI